MVRHVGSSYHVSKLKFNAYNLVDSTITSTQPPKLSDKFLIS